MPDTLWHGMADVRRTVCNRDCPDTCAILATVEDGKVVKLQGDPAHPITRGFLCYRTNHFLDRQYSPERLNAPLLRKDGELVPVSWDEALDVAAERLQTIRAESGPAAIFHYRSGGSLGMLTKTADYFFHRFGPVTIKHGDICSAAGEVAQEIDFGLCDSSDPSDLLNARHVILWGKNLHVSSPHLLPTLKTARKGGTKLVQIDPIFHRSSDFCDDVVMPRPGGDYALAMAIARCCFDRGWVNPQAAEFCDNLDGFRGLVEQRTVAEWSALADVAVDVVVDLARRFGEDGPVSIQVGWGMGRRTNGATIVRALDALGAVTGNIGVAGAGVSFYYQRQAAFAPLYDAAAEPPPRTLAEPLFGPENLAAQDPPVRALWVTAGNPVASLPESTTNAEAVRKTEFVVVVDSFLTDTGRLADLVLPTTTLLEDDDLLGAYGQPYLSASSPVVPAPASVKSDLEIMQGLAERVGLAEEMAGSARDWKRRFAAPLEEKGISVDQLEREAVRRPDAPAVVFEGREFPTKTGKVNLMTEAAEPALTETLPDFPLLLHSVSTAKSQCTQWVKEPEGPISVTVHPEAPGAPADGSLAILESRVGAIEVRVVHDARQRRDIALVPKGGIYHKGQAANALIKARLTDLGDGASLHDQPVRLRPA